MPNDDYSEIEDFLEDNLFIEWVIEQTQSADLYWKDFQQKYPEKKELIADARLILLSFNIKPVCGLSEQQKDQIIENVHRRAKFNSEANLRLKRKDYFLKYAAVLTIGLIAGLIGYFSSQDKPSKAITVSATSQYREVFNNTNKSQFVKLPDNSSVILRPGARLTFPSYFSEKQREVQLSGVAFFEVVKDASRPFNVYSDELKVKVLGTSFCVKANRADDIFKVVVSTGKVSVSAKRQKASDREEQNVLLSPNQQVLLYRKSLKLEKTSLEKPLMLSKESAKIHFNFISTPFSEVVSTIQKAYDVDIIYNENQMKNCSLTASLIEQPLDERLRLICKAVEADYKILGGKIIIEGKGCAD